MADRKEYVIYINGLPHTYSLTSEQAKQRGLTDADVKQEPKPANKARSARNK